MTWHTQTPPPTHIRFHDRPRRASVRSANSNVRIGRGTIPEKSNNIAILGVRTRANDVNLLRHGHGAMGVDGCFSGKHGLKRVSKIKKMIVVVVLLFRGFSVSAVPVVPKLSK